MTESRQVIGKRFEIADPERDLLGRGGMGDVYRGRDLQTGQAVAIKALRPEVVASDPNALARFLREGDQAVPRLRERFVFGQFAEIGRRQGFGQGQHKADIAGRRIGVANHRLGVGHHKAGITDPNEPVQMYRFEVKRYT